jgi:signal transduction histidine kinase
VAGVLLAVLAVAQVIALPRGQSWIDFAHGVGLVLLALFSTLPLGLLWSYPPGAAVAVGAACVLSLAAFDTLTVAGLIAQLIVLYRLGRSGQQLLAAVLALPYLVLALFPPAGTADRILTVLLAALAPAAAWAGAARRARSEAVEHSAAREVIAGSLLEHTARGERARVSRELHDVVAHHISMIAVQAETARLTTPGMPAAGAQRLSAIGDTARTALTEMRRLLGVLREDTRADAGGDRRPQPGLRQLSELLDEARDASGSGIRLIVHGPVASLDPGVELAAYRIVQEALTNVLKHASGAPSQVVLRWDDGALELEVVDQGPLQNGAPPDAPPGRGLAGMRERAAMYGGTLDARPEPELGYLVRAHIPLEPRGA